MHYLTMSELLITRKAVSRHFRRHGKELKNKMGLQVNLPKPASNFGKLDLHDAKVLAFHVLIGIIQTYLIGAGIEHPTWAPAIQTAAELLRRLAF